MRAKTHVNVTSFFSNGNKNLNWLQRRNLFTAECDLKTVFSSLNTDMFWKKAFPCPSFWSLFWKAAEKICRRVPHPVLLARTSWYFESVNRFRSLASVRIKEKKMVTLYITNSRSTIWLQIQSPVPTLLTKYSTAPSTGLKRYALWWV